MASSCGTDADKSALRACFLSARMSVPAGRRASADARIRSQLLAWGPWRRAALVLSYVSFGAEVDTRGLIEEAWRSGKAVAVPRCLPREHGLEFCVVRSRGDLVPGFHGILEPAADAPRVGVRQMVGSVCLVPGLVFDAAGHRVGYGGGYYDRFLAFYPGEKVGLARRAMVSGNPLPHEATDVAVDHVATESGVWGCR